MFVERAFTNIADEPRKMKEIIGYYRFRKRYKITSILGNDLNIEFRSFEMRTKWEAHIKNYYYKQKRYITTINMSKPAQMIYDYDYISILKILNLFTNFLWEYRMIIPNIDYKKIGGLFMMEELAK